MIDYPTEYEYVFERVEEQADGCWNWTATEQSWGTRGYGRTHIRGNRGVRKLAHRFVYEILVGEIPEGLVLDHLCRNRLCVNPAHLEPVTNRENILRGDGITARQARQTHCKRGHPFDEQNTRRYIWLGTERRSCRACARDYHREYRKTYVRKPTRSGLSQGEQGRSHQERTTAGFSPGTDSCPVPTTPNTFEAAA
jgi:hypothetical protein